MGKVSGRAGLWWTALLTVAACSSLEPAPVQPNSGAGVGGSGVYIHGSAACGNTAGTAGASGGGGVTGSGSGDALPSDFGTGGSLGGATSSSESGGATSGAGSSGGAPGSGGSVAGAGGEAPAQLGHALLFTEYVEGSSSYKALEISAIEDSTLEGCRIATYFNGATTATGISLEGTLIGGETSVLCSSALAGLGVACDRVTSLSFNGDDAVVLECDGVVVDVIGQVGLDPGNAWGSGDSSTLDHTLRRKCDASADSDALDAFDPALQWQGYAQDTFDDLGARDCSSDGAAGASGADG